MTDIDETAINASTPLDDVFSEPAVIDVVGSATQSESHAVDANDLLPGGERLGGITDVPSPHGSTTSSSATISAATARWFGMLADDADFELDITLPAQLDDSSYSNIQARTPDELISPLSTGYQPSHSATDPCTSATFEDAPSTEPTTLGTDTIVVGQALLEDVWRSQFPITLHSHEQPLFENFVQRVSCWLDLFDPYRHFSTLVPRLALHNVGLMNAVLALSIRHLSLNRSLCAERLFSREDALSYYQETLIYIRTAMQYRSYNTSLELLATTLVVSSYEMLDGSPKDWERHLQGVFWIQRSQLIHGDSGGLRGANWWAWLCQDIWAAFREKRTVFTFWKPVKQLSDLNPWELSTRSVFLFARVVDFCSRIESRDSTFELTQRIDVADHLSSQLDDWFMRLTPEFRALPSNGDSGVPEFKKIWVHPPSFGRKSNKVLSAHILISRSRLFASISCC